MVMPFIAGDVVFWTDPDDGICSGRYTIECIFGETIELINDNGSEVQCLESEIEHVVKLFSVCFTHHHGSEQYIVRSEIIPTEEQVAEVIGLDFEPERDESIDIEEITTIYSLELE